MFYRQEKSLFNTSNISTIRQRQEGDEAPRIHGYLSAKAQYLRLEAEALVLSMQALTGEAPKQKPEYTEVNFKGVDSWVLKFSGGPLRKAEKFKQMLHSLGCMEGDIIKPVSIDPDVKLHLESGDLPAAKIAYVFQDAARSGSTVYFSTRPGFMRSTRREIPETIDQVCDALKHQGLVFNPA